MRKAFLCLPFLLLASKVHAVSTGTYTVIWNPYGGHNQYVSPSSTQTIAGGLNITVTTTSTGVLISASTGSAAGGVTIYPSTGTNASITRGLSVSTVSFVSVSSGNFIYLMGNPFMYTTYTVIMINPGGNLVTTLTDPTPQITTLGYGAGIRVHGASDITAIGSSALANDTDDTDNTAVGTNALLNHTGAAGTTGYNSAFGSHCLDLMTTGYYNTCVGVNGFGAATWAGASIGIGVNELNLVQYPSYGNIGIGFSSLGFITTGSSNTATGHLSGVNMGGSSSDNVFYGALSGYNVLSATGVVQIGAVDTPNVVTASSNSIAIGWDVTLPASNNAQIGGIEGSGKEINLKASSATFKNQVKAGQIIDAGLASGPVRSNSLGTLSTGTITTNELQGQISLSTQVVGTLVGYVTTSGSNTFTGSNTLTSSNTFTSTVSVTNLNATYISGTRNMILNGDFRIDQRYVGAKLNVVTATNPFTADQWRATAQSFDGSFSVQRISTTTLFGFTHCMEIIVISSDGALTGNQRYQFQQNLEGSAVKQIGFGSALASTCTLSFWVRSSTTGSMGVTFINSSAARGFGALYVINSSATWEYKTLVIPPDVTGTWTTTDYSNGIQVSFSLGASSARSVTAGSWTGTFAQGVTGQNALISCPAGSSWEVTGVQFEIGQTASYYEYVPDYEMLRRCQRFYQKSFSQASAPAQNINYSSGTASYFTHVAGLDNDGIKQPFVVSFATNPTVVTYNPYAANNKWRNETGATDSGTPTISNVGQEGCVILNPQVAITDALGNLLSVHWSAEGGL